MKSFTYCDYIKCIHTLRLNAVLKLAETEENYTPIENKKEKIKKEKLTQEILKNKKEMANFLNDFLEPRDKIKENDLIRCLNYKNKKYRYKSPELIYYLKSQKLIFVIEEENKIDDSIKYRMLNYCIDFMQEYISKFKYEEENKYPIIIPILIYTGDKKINKNIREKDTDKKIGKYVFENYEIDFEYNLIDLNRYNLKYLIERNTLISYAMILEKAKKTQEIKEILKVI